MQTSEHNLKQVFSDVFGVDPGEINDATTIDTIEQWDSLKHLNLVLALEEQFNVTLSEEETLQILSYPLIKLVLAEHGIQFQ